jgi:hypothetical protein
MKTNLRAISKTVATFFTVKVSLFEMNVAFVLEDVGRFVEELVTHVARILSLTKAAVTPFHMAGEGRTHLVSEINIGNYSEFQRFRS